MLGSAPLHRMKQGKVCALAFASMRSSACFPFMGKDSPSTSSNAQGLITIYLFGKRPCIHQSKDSAISAIEGQIVPKMR